MLIDARHPEETRVTVVKGSRVEEFDYESASKRPLKGNIYLARVTRVEPSLQAAFVEYGGNRHGFLAFSEIHPDYYQIPVEDRQELIEAETKAALERAQELDAKLEKEAEEAEKKKKPRRRRRRKKDDQVETSDANTDDTEAASTEKADTSDEAAAEAASTVGESIVSEDAAATDESVSKDEPEEKASNESSESSDADETADSDDEDADGKESDEADKDAEIAEAAARRQALRALKRRYSIQEVIKRRQVLLVQVVKEERGNKGAALTTYMSLAGRYCVLMPNSTHSGGISRKISNASDRRSLKKIISSLEVPDEMGLIVRTAGMERTKTEIKRDYDYLLRLWNGIRDLTLKSVAPTLIYEEGNLIKRTIRDLYTRDIDEIQVEGEAGYRAAKDFMKLLMPSHAKKVQHYQDPIPLFHRYQVESHLEAMYQPVVQLKSGGYIVINPTEALISIDVNSGRATKEHNIEETAVKTNLEAAEEVARQLRLRDMAGLVVIDFIDMEERSNNRAVERRMKEVLKSDRARIQVGRISSFGLMEMSRQRLRSNLLEVSMETCPHCSGTGIVRSTESAALMALRLLEEEGIRTRSSIVRVSVCPEVAVYLLNTKRRILTDLETQYSFEIEVLAQPSMGPSDIEITREASSGASNNNTAQVVKPDTSADDMPAPAASSDDNEDGEKQPRKRRRRRRRRRGGGDQAERAAAANENETSEVEVASDKSDEDSSEGNSEERKPRRRRGSRGGRRRAERGPQDEAAADAESAGDPEANTSDPAPAEEDKPRRRRRVKKKETASDEDTGGSEAAETQQTETEEKPKARRTRRRKPAAEADKSDSADIEAKDEAEKKPRRRRKTAESEPAEAVTDAGKTDEEKKPRRRTRKKAEPKAEDAGNQEAEADKPKRGRPRKTTAKPATDEPTQPAEAKPDSSKTAAAEPSDTGDKPKRQGWWQRTFG